MKLIQSSTDITSIHETSPVNVELLSSHMDVLEQTIRELRTVSNLRVRGSELHEWLLRKAAHVGLIDRNQLPLAIWSNGLKAELLNYVASEEDDENYAASALEFYLIYGAAGNFVIDPARIDKLLAYIENCFGEDRVFYSSNGLEMLALLNLVSPQSLAGFELTEDSMRIITNNFDNYINNPNDLDSLYMLLSSLHYLHLTDPAYTNVSMLERYLTPAVLEGFFTLLQSPLDVDELHSITVTWAYLQELCGNVIRWNDKLILTPPSANDLATDLPNSLIF